jgi:hypothetical protein
LHIKVESAENLAWGVLVVLVLLKLSLHFGTNLLGPYGFHRDEFLYMAMGEHLRLWHMDFPPAVAIASEVTRWVLGDSLFSVRLFPAIFSSALVCFAMVVAWELGGGRFAQALAGLAVVCHILFLRSGNLFQPVVFDQLWWTVGLYALLRLCRHGEPRWWLLFGAACGFGLLSKFSILVFGLAVFLALLTTSYRRSLLTHWPWLALFIVLVIGSPSIVGQISLGFPVLDQMGDLRSAQLARVTPLQFVTAQLLMGVGAVVAVVGLAALVLAKQWQAYRLVGWACLWSLIVLMVLHGKDYYAGPIYPTLFGVGAVVLERWDLTPWAPIVRWATATGIVLYAALLLPMGLPILGPAAMERYLERLGSEDAVTTNVGAVERLPQDYADMLGWEEQVQAVGRVYHDLDPVDRAKAVILGSNYGEAGAIDFFGSRHGLPSAIAVVGTYWFFGPGELPGEVVVALGFDRGELTSFFDVVEPAAFVTHHYAVAEQRDLTVFVCRGARETLQEAWPRYEGQQ